MIEIVLVDDQELVRAGLRALAEQDGDIRVVGEAGDGARGVEEARRTRPDVVLMDLRMPGADGLTAIGEITADPDLAGVHVAVMTTFDEDEHVLGAIRAGAAGYLLKDIAPPDLRSALRRLASGDALLAPAVTRRVMIELASRPDTRHRPELVAGLTARERDVLTAVGHGLDNGEIGRALSISPATARTHVGRLLPKLGARDRVQLVVLAYEAGLVRPGSTSR